MAMSHEEQEEGEEEEEEEDDEEEDKFRTRGQGLQHEQRSPKQLYIDQLLAEIWPADFDNLLDSPWDVLPSSGHQRNVDKKRANYGNNNNNSSSSSARSCPASPAAPPSALYWRQSLDDDDDDAGARETADAVDAQVVVVRTRNTPRYQSNEQLWNETWKEQQRLECQVALLRRQLIDSACSYMQQQQQQQQPATSSTSTTTTTEPLYSNIAI